MWSDIVFCIVMKLKKPEHQQNVCPHFSNNGKTGERTMLVRVQVYLYNTP